MDEIINKVAQSGLVELNLEDYFPKGERMLLDIKDNLFQGLILKEKDFRAFVEQEKWEKYKDKFVAIYCSADAIIPTWAYMLLAVALQPYAKKTVFGTIEILNAILFAESLARINPVDYTDKRVVIKGCSNLPVPTQAYVQITELLRPFAKSIMYGEACSTVPLYKKKTS